MIDADILAHVPVGDSDFFDSPYLDFLAEDPFVLTRFPVSYRRVEKWGELAARRRARAPAAMWEELAEAHARWGAPEASRRALAALADGQAVAVVAGQQPDALGGPLYTLHKALTAVALARALERRAGARAVPVFWSANEDSDFEEVRSVRLQNAALEVVEVSLPESARVPGGMVGHVPRDALLESWDGARRAWRGLSGAATAGAWLDLARERAVDLGDAQAVILLAALGDRGLVVLDPRLPSFRAAADPVYRGYLDRHEAVRAAVEAAGRALEGRGHAPAIGPAQSAFSLFGVDRGMRVKLDLAGAQEALARGAAFSPNVVLRPVVQDALLPVVFLVAGPGEIAYLSQLREVYEQLGVEMGVVFPRLSATWLPAAALALARAHGVEPWDLVRDADGALREAARRALPAAVCDELERVRREANDGLAGFAASAATVDASLPQLVESARGKVDYQFGRVLEALVTKMRARLERAHPQAARLRHALLPGGRPQERRLAWLDLVARGGEKALARGGEVAAEHVERALAGRTSHMLVALPEGDGA